MVVHANYRPFLNCAQKSECVWKVSGVGVIPGSGMLELLL
jgi:hypothetical protein